jgi:hypothetical protein
VIADCAMCSIRVSRVDAQASCLRGAGGGPFGVLWVGSAGSPPGQGGRPAQKNRLQMRSLTEANSVFDCRSAIGVMDGPVHALS